MIQKIPLIQKLLLIDSNNPLSKRAVTDPPICCSIYIKNYISHCIVYNGYVSVGQYIYSHYPIGIILKMKQINEIEARNGTESETEVKMTFFSGKEDRVRRSHPMTAEYTSDSIKEIYFNQIKAISLKMRR